MGVRFFSTPMCARLEAGRWLVGVSGGGDSVALLRLLLDLGLREQLVVGNFNHGWGRFGDASAEFTRSLANMQGVAFAAGHGSGKAATNAEALARAERYDWFEATVREHGLDGVIVAHTREDVVETFLMRAGKGSGLQGLSGMAEVTPRGAMQVVRPLLNAGREELREYLRGKAQVWMEDPDNEEGGSQRARIRKVLPLLEEVGVGVEALAASVAALRDAEELVVSVADNVDITWREDGRAVVELGALRKVLTEAGVRVLARLMRELNPDTMVVRRGKRVALLERLKHEDKGHATLGGLKFEWGEGRILARPE